MSDAEAILILIQMASILLCLPYLICRVVPYLVKLAHVHWFPPKFIDVEIIDGDKVVKERISLKDKKALVEALLKTPKKEV